MDVVRLFGDIVGRTAQSRPVLARRILLTGYRLQNAKNKIAPNRRIPPSGQYVARVVMEEVIEALSHPQNAVMTSIFVPGELFSASGLTPYSVETLSCFMTGTKCEQTFLRGADREGFPETMCSYHRIFLGTAISGILPAPRCVLYTNLACDGNLMTFPHMKDTYQIPGFYIDVPYEKNPEAVDYVAGQLRQAKAFLSDCTGRTITDEALKKAVANSDQAAGYFAKQLSLRRTQNPPTTLTNELYAIFMCMILAGSAESVEYARLLYEDVKKAPQKASDIGILWMHIMPFMQQPVIDLFNFSDSVHIKSCDFVYGGFIPMDAENPYEAMAAKLVYSIYNGSVKERIARAIEVAAQTNADGVVLFAHWGCTSTIGASSLIKKELEAAGIPVLVLDGDGCNPANSSDGQVSTRLQAFMEMLAGRKREKTS